MAALTPLGTRQRRGITRCVNFRGYRYILETETAPITERHFLYRDKALQRAASW